MKILCDVVAACSGVQGTCSDVQRRAVACKERAVTCRGVQRREVTCRSVQRRAWGRAVRVEHTILLLVLSIDDSNTKALKKYIKNTLGASDDAWYST